MNEALDKIDMKERMKRRWGKEKSPQRKFVIWGKDKNNNPSFMILFGTHKFQKTQLTINETDITTFNESLKQDLKPEINPGTYNLLRDNVNYVGYTILNGKSGHLPAYIDLKLMLYEEYPYYGRGYYYTRRRYRQESAPTKKEYYLTDQKGYFSSMKSVDGWVRTSKLPEAAQFYSFPDSKEILFPYFENLTYEDSIKKLVEELPKFYDFEIAIDPNNVLGLDEKSKEYLDLLISLFSDQNLYQRKKALNTLIDRKPPKNIYLKILEIGGIDVISGLFLELAKRRNSILKAEAIKLQNSNIKWAPSNQSEGLKRCIKIYLTAINPESLSKRIKEIEKLIPKMELKALSGRIIRMGGRRDRWRYNNLKKHKKGTDYDDYVTSWGSNEWQIIGPTLQFQPNIITDGSSLFIPVLKNILQEIEIYHLPEIFGRIGAFIDSVKLYYLSRHKKGSLIYLKRYVKRIFLNYLKQDEEALRTALKSFMINYKKSYIFDPYHHGSGSITVINDLLAYFLDNYEKSFSKSQNRYYYSYRSKLVPQLRGKNHRNERMRQNARKAMKLLKDQVNDIVEITIKSDVNRILNFCMGVIRKHQEYVFESLTPKELVELVLSSNHKVSNFFKVTLDEKIDTSENFDSRLMLALMGCNNITLQEKSWEYYERTKGKFTVEMILEILLLQNLEIWSEFFNERLSEISSKQLYPFFIGIFNQVNTFAEREIELPEHFIISLDNISKRITELNKTQIEEIFSVSLDLVKSKMQYPDWFLNYLQNLIFSLSYDDLVKLSANLKIDLNELLPNERRNCVIHLLKAFRTTKIPSEREIVNILSFGASQTVHKFVKFIEQNKEQLKSRLSRLLLLFESNMVALNAIAAEVFESLPAVQFKETLSQLIDSPELRVQSYVIRIMNDIYDDMIPEEFLIQMLEHGSPEIKSYISDKIKLAIESLGNGNADLFIYYSKTLLFLPNYKSKSKDRIYDLIPEFTIKYKEKYPEIEQMLLELGGSNIIKDSERALVALALIKKEGM